MIITIVADQGMVGVNRDFRKVSLAGLNANIETVQWDTVKNAGVITFQEDVMIASQERDLAAEAAAEVEPRQKLEAAEQDLAAAIAAKAGEVVIRNRRILVRNARLAVEALGPIYVGTQIQRPPQRFTNFQPFLVFLTRWNAAPPATPAQPPPVTPGPRAPTIRDLIEILIAKDLITRADVDSVINPPSG